MIEPKKIEIDKNKPVKPVGCAVKSLPYNVYEEYYFCPICGAQVLPRCNCPCGQVICWNIEQGV